jgi:hypothetical protein
MLTGNSWANGASTYLKPWQSCLPLQASRVGVVFLAHGLTDLENATAESLEKFTISTLADSQNPTKPSAGN